MLSRRDPTWRGVVLWITPLLLFAGQTPAAQDALAAAGREFYLRECATCHGNAATGYGPAWPLLREPPPDLTVLERPQRPFERSRIRALVTGHMRRVPPQWPSQMPYWPGVPASELDALLAYLESVQRTPYGPTRGITISDQARLGAPLFKTLCASCHGDDGRGRRPDSYVVGIAIPDLSTIASRGDGTVDMRRLYESIARCGSDDTGMPAWERTLRHMGWTAFMAARHLEDIAWYVESLQQR